MKFFESTVNGLYYSDYVTKRRVQWTVHSFWELLRHVYIMSGIVTFQND